MLRPPVVHSGSRSGYRPSGHTVVTSTPTRKRGGQPPVQGLALIGCADTAAQDTAQLVWLCDLDRVSIGRGEPFRTEVGPREIELRVPDGRVSAHHLTLQRGRGTWVLRDAGARHGTLIRGQKRTEVTLRPGDVFQTGRTFWRYVEHRPYTGTTSSGETSAALGPTRTICPAFIEQIAKASLCAPSEGPVLILGETGVGKDVLARQIHAWSGRKGDFLAVNCPGIPKASWERELFGHVKDIFPGVHKDAAGYIEAAAPGTVLLDEIGELEPEAQAKLLRVLANHEITRVGEARPRKVDVRILAATNRNVPELLGRGFREDLYARFTHVLQVPPLRERIEDVGILLAHFLRPHGKQAASSVDSELFRRLLAGPWRLNVREMEHALECALLAARGAPDLLSEHLTLPDEPEQPQAQEPSPQLATEASKSRLPEALARLEGNVTAAAKELGVSRMTINRWCKELAVNPRQHRKSRK